MAVAQHLCLYMDLFPVKILLKTLFQDAPLDHNTSPPEVDSYVDPNIVINQAAKLLPFDTNAGSWKQRLLPPPVGIITMQSLPDKVAFIACSWNGRKFSTLNKDFLSSSSFADHSKSTLKHKLHQHKLNKKGTEWKGKIDMTTHHFSISKNLYSTKNHYHLHAAAPQKYRNIFANKVTCS